MTTKIEENIFQTNLIEEVSESFINYALSVITDRALPDVRDGLKPVHRRILYAMSLLGLTHNKPYKKSARVVGDVLGKFHPHGDSSVYDAMVRLAQDFSLRYPLVEGQGNFGSIDGDSAAHMRYTEARMSKIAGEMLKDLEKNTVNFKLNFSEDEKEPTVLTSRFPNLLVNGTTGIAVGMACSFPSHNLGQAVETVKAFIKDENITMEDLMESLQGPDFPTGGIIVNKSELLEGYSTGRGRVRIRGKYEIEKKRNKESIIFTEIPYMVKKEKIITDIVELIKKKEIEGISDVFDASDKNIRIVIEVASGFNAEELVSYLFTKTQLEETFSLNFTGLVGGEPRTLTYKELISEYVEFQRDVLYRRTEFEHAKIVAKVNITQGLIIALAEIDKVISIIKGSASTREAGSELIKQFLLNEEQAKAVLAMRLSRLTKLEVEELKQELKDLLIEKARLEAIMADTAEIDKIIVADLDLIVKTYGDARRTEITQADFERAKKGKAEKVSQPVTIAIDNNLNVKSMGKIKTPARFTISTTTVDHLIAFGSDGRTFRVAVEDLKVGANLLKTLEIKDINIVSILPKVDTKYVVMITKNGYIKKSPISEYQEIKRNGTIGIKLKDNDLVSEVLFMDEEDLVVFTKNGMSIHIKTNELTPTGRNSLGVLGMKLKEEDEIVGAAAIKQNTKYVATITRKGQAKKTEMDQFPIQNRNGVGVISHKLNSGDSVVSVLALSDNDSLIVFESKKEKVFKATDIPTVGRNSIGNILIKTEDLKNALVL